MKKIITFKTFLSILLVMSIHLGFGQNDYLKITRSTIQNDFIKYPPGTTFQLIDENNTIVYSDKSIEKEFIITKPYTLKVNPPYKDQANLYYLNAGKVEIKNNVKYFEAIKAHQKTKTKKDFKPFNYDEDEFTYGLTMKKTLERSTLNPKQYNATFEFNNGIIATFTDGEMIAILDGEQLKIEGYYLIHSKDGLIKLSFSPSNGETWWVFEPKED